jgi:DNA-binding NarL/FixJ family response regulator
VVSVLIVDDHAPFRATVRALLEGQGFEVVGEAEDGESALIAAEELKPDIVLLDVQLPGIDGFEVAERLRLKGNVILTSSRDLSEYGGLIKRCGARGFVPKAELSGGRLTALLN